MQVNLPAEQRRRRSDERICARANESADAQVMVAGRQRTCCRADVVIGQIGDASSCVEKALSVLTGMS